MNEDKLSKLKYWWDLLETEWTKLDEEKLRRRLYILDAEIRNTLKGEASTRRSTLTYYLRHAIPAIALLLLVITSLTLVILRGTLKEPWPTTAIAEKVASEDSTLTQVPDKATEPEAEILKGSLASNVSAPAQLPKAIGSGRDELRTKAGRSRLAPRVVPSSAFATEVATGEEKASTAPSLENTMKSAAATDGSTNEKASTGPPGTVSSNVPQKEQRPKLNPIELLLAFEEEFTGK